MLVGILLFAVLGNSVGPSANAATRDEPCWWLDLIDNTGLDEMEFYPAVGCRLNEDDEWVEGRILADDQYIIDVPRDVRREVRNAADIVLDEIERMLEDDQIQRVFRYDIETGELEPGRLFYDRDRPSNEALIELEGEPLYGRVDGEWGEHYEQAALSYLDLPGNGVLAGYVAWYVRWRDSAVQAVMDGGGYTNPTADQQIRIRGNYQWMPRPWQLADENAITVFLLWVLENASTD